MPSSADSNGMAPVWWWRPLPFLAHIELQHGGRVVGWRDAIENVVGQACGVDMSRFHVIEDAI